MPAAELAGVPPALAAKLQSLEEREPELGMGGRSRPDYELKDADNTSLAPYEVPATLQSTVDELGLRVNLDEMQSRGFTVLEGCASIELCDALVELAKAHNEGGSGFHFLGKNPVPEALEAITCPKMLALAEVMCGKSFKLSQCATSVQQQHPTHRGIAAAGLHSDQNWVPAPFPEHNQIVTGCFVLSDDYTLESGATCAAPNPCPPACACGGIVADVAPVALGQASCPAAICCVATPPASRWQTAPPCSSRSPPLAAALWYGTGRSGIRP